MNCGVWAYLSKVSQLGRSLPNTLCEIDVRPQKNVSLFARSLTHVAPLRQHPNHPPNPGIHTR